MSSLKACFREKRSGLVAVATVFAMSFCLCLSAAAQDVVDTFSRADSTDLGVTEDPNHWQWLEAGGDLQILNGTLDMPTGGMAVIDQTAGGTLFRPADIELSATMVSAAGSYVAMSYRNTGLGSNPYANGGYSLWVLKTGGVYMYSTWLGPTGVGDIGVQDLTVPHTMRILVVGNSHKAWWDGNLVVDTADPGLPVLAGGYVYLTDGENLNGITWDNVEATIIPEPASMLALLCGLGGLFSLRRRSARS